MRSADATTRARRRFTIMNQPKIQTDNLPPEGASPDYNPTGTTPHGIPEELAKSDVSGRPNDDRIASETAVQKSGS